MDIFISKFNTTAEYTTAKSSLLKPHVSLTKDSGNVHYDPIDYATKYLTFVALENGTFTLNSDGDGDSIDYSLDGGETWTNLTSKTASPIVTAGNRIMWKGQLTPDTINIFESTGRFNAEGNIMSILFDNNFEGQTDISDFQYGNAFEGTFSGNTNLVSAKNLSLPATAIFDRCYANMFYGCTSLTEAPKILPATTLANYCYENMFSGCTGLTTAPELPATTLAIECYNNMFNGCTSLTTAPELPATTLAGSCYFDMFYGCTSLTTAPELPATTLAVSCYFNMFRDCTSLTTAPELPATTLANSCYRQMFEGCTSLTTAPELPAQALANNCYQYMFYGCTNLNYIKAMFTTTPSGSSPNYYTQNWVNGVAATGTFVKNKAATWNLRGVNGIPNNWTIETASA